MSGTLEAIMKKFIALCKVYQKLSLLNYLHSNNDVCCLLYTSDAADE
mgnify:CR=1 FL=1